MEWILFITAGLALLGWLALFPLHRGFRDEEPRLETDLPTLSDWPGVAILVTVPRHTRDAVLEESLERLLDQDYAGPFHVILVDDRSDEILAEAAKRIAHEASAAERLTVVGTPARPPGWSARRWALAAGHEAARGRLPQTRYLWVTDAATVHRSDNLRELVAKAEAERLDMVSLVPYHECETPWAKLLVPALLFVLLLLRPLRRVNDPKARIAAAANACILLRAEVLDEIGGFAGLAELDEAGEKTGEALIADQPARRIKSAARARGRGVWLGLSEEVFGTGNASPWAIWRLARGGPLGALLAKPREGAAALVAGALLMVLPPVLALWALIAGLFLDIELFFVTYLALLAAIGAWAALAWAAWPTFRLYEQPEWMTLLMPLAGLFFLLMGLGAAMRAAIQVRPSAKAAALPVPRKSPTLGRLRKSG